MKYRSRTDVIASILNSAKAEEGTLMTRIMYSSFLSFTQVKRFLKLLTENDLLEYDEINKVYKTTGKGLRFLVLYEKMDALLKIQQTAK
jgi:predicted transcriptional regulator